MRDLIRTDRLLEFFNAIEGGLYRYPALDGRSFRLSVEETVARLRGGA